MSEERVAVVTGGAGAIGAAIAGALAAVGHRVVVLDRTGDVPCDLAREDDTRAAAATVLARQALNRTLVPADVAGTVVHLASDAGAALTGQVLCVDGGLVLR